MPALHLDPVPDDLYRRIEELATSDRLTPAAEALRLLHEAVSQKPPAVRSQREVLDEIARGQFLPLANGPSVVEMLREDRER